MLRPGAVDLPQSTERSVPLAAVAHSLQVDARRQFAAVYEDITQYMDKCEYLFDHDEFYDVSYKSLSKTVAQLNKIGTDAQQQEREQLYTGLLDWLNTSSFSLEAPTHGIINEHQLIESAQTTRDVLVKILLGLERLRAAHISITDKARAATERARQQTDKTDNKRQLLKMVDDSSFVWKTSAAEIVQLLHDERSKGGELVELYADKIRYLMGELEAQSGMIAELRAQLDTQQQLPLKLHDVDVKVKRAKQEATLRQAKLAVVGQQQTTSDDIDDEDRTAAGVSILPDFNKQLVATLQKELEECRRHNANVVARGHEAAAKIRFLTEENNRKDKQIAQLQANVAKLKSDTREVESSSVVNVETSSREDKQRKQTVRMSHSRAGRQGRQRRMESIHVQEKEADDSTDGRMKLTQLVAAAKRQKRPPPADVLSAQPTRQSVADEDVAAVADHTDTSRTGRATASTKPGKSTRGLRGRTKTGAAASDKQQEAADDVPQMGSFWQKTALKEWTPLGTDVDNTGTGDEMKTAGDGSVVRQTLPVSDVGMSEAIEMTKLFLAGSQTQQQQQQSMKGRQHASVDEQRIPQPTATHVTAVSPQLFAESSAMKTPVTHQQLLQRNVAPSPHPADAVRWRQQRARTPAEAAKVRAARLSLELFQSDDTRRTPNERPPAVQQQKQQKNVVATNSSPLGKAADYDLVGVQMHNLARQAKLLERTSRQRFSDRR